MKRHNGTALARVGAVLLPCAAMLLGTGCYAEAYPATVSVQPAVVDDDFVTVGVGVVPADIAIYPHYYYGGGYAYYVDGRWYRQGPRGWGYYRRVPPPLAHYEPYARGWRHPGVVERQGPYPRGYTWHNYYGHPR